MRILYGVVGEGMGHATRSRVVIEHLLASRGPDGEQHEIEIVVSGRAFELLDRVFGQNSGSAVRKIHGLTMAYADNEVQKRLTLIENIDALRGGLPQNVRQYFKLIEAFSPDVTISDFDSWTYLFSKLHRVPVISIDNMQIINRGDHSEVFDAGLLPGQKKAFRLSQAIVKAKLPGCAHYFATTFFSPPVRKERTTWVPPILRPAVLAAKATARAGDHVLVYQTAEGNQQLIDAMRSLPATPFRVYGMRRDIDAPTADGNLLHCPFSEQGFIDDLASARAVIAGGGFSLMSECVYLGKPLLTVPLAGQFEQILNAAWLQHLGFGLYRDTIAQPDIEELIARSAELAQNLARHRQDGNRMLLDALDAKLVQLHKR